MDPPSHTGLSIPFTEDELKKVGLLGEGVSTFTTEVLNTMREHPDLLKLSLFTLECIDQDLRSNPSSSRAYGIPKDVTMAPNLSVDGPNKYERMSYYNGITGDNKHPDLIYRLDYLTMPFPKPTGRFARLPVIICELIKARKINWLSINPACFFTHPLPEDTKGILGPVVIWIGVPPGSTITDTAHKVSQEILTLLQKNRVDNAVVEWCEAVLQRLAGPPLMRHVAMPPIIEELEEEDLQGTLTLWFHENKDNDGNPSDKVYRVSSCHVLRKNTTINYEHRYGTPMSRVWRGLDDIILAISSHAILTDLCVRELVKLQAKERQDARVIKAKQRQLETEAISDLEALHEDVTKDWSNLKLHRNIGHIQYAEAILVDAEGGTLYTSDWAAFLAAEPKVRDEFEGYIVDLRFKYKPYDLMRMLYPGGVPATFKYPTWGKLQIEGCATKEDLFYPAGLNSEGQRCLMVGKDGNTMTSPIESIELGIYNSGDKTFEVFLAKGDSGSLVWHMTEGKAHIVGQIHSGENKGGLTSNHMLKL
ncbi:hypothetical protein BDP27DRAFT_1491913 [Rhodocollybia butyracea]|uniref:Uncharacterized protein n=1 Tax=Rhodocollybia butyracea TaxID=206335 RepID=A0A9P5PCD8_9AGAR|nr:hypothetical protein BDP27DRAFT_1491913 [Rhodocollybia butyracea]